MQELLQIVELCVHKDVTMVVDVFHLEDVPADLDGQVITADQTLMNVAEIHILAVKYVLMILELITVIVSLGTTN